MLPEDIEENLQHIKLLTRKMIRNPLVGTHASLLRGEGFEFWEHRKYQVGDDFRKVDWNATARVGHPVVKNTQEERDLDAILAVDMSGSMAFGSARYSKKELLLYIVATLGYSALSDHIRVGLLAFSDRVEMARDPRHSEHHLWHLLEDLYTLQAAGRGTRARPILEELARLSKRRMSMIFLISDFEFDDDLMAGGRLRNLALRHDLIPILLTDRLENTLPAGRGLMQLADLETGKKRWIRLTEKNRSRFEQIRRQQRARLLDQFYQLKLDFLEIRTDQPFQELLMNLFLLRSRA